MTDETTSAATAPKASKWGIPSYDFSADDFGDIGGISEASLDAVNNEVLVQNWQGMTSAAQAALIEDMADWVDWMIETYRIKSPVIPTCWYRHTEIVQELYAMKLLHTLCYSLNDAGSGPASFVERFTQSQVRLRGYVQDAGCKSSGEHQVARGVQLTNRESPAWLDLVELSESEGVTGDEPNTIEP